MRYGIFSFPRVVLFIPNEERIKSVFDNRPRLLKFFTQWIDHEAPVVEIKEKVESKKLLEDDTKASISASIGSVIGNILNNL